MEQIIYWPCDYFKNQFAKKNPPLSRKVNKKNTSSAVIPWDLRQVVKGEWPRVAKESPWPDLCKVARLWGAAIEKIYGSKDEISDIFWYHIWCLDVFGQQWYHNFLSNI